MVVLISGVMASQPCMALGKYVTAEGRLAGNGLGVRFGTDNGCFVRGQCGKPDKFVSGNRSVARLFERDAFCAFFWCCRLHLGRDGFQQFWWGGC